MAFTDTDGDDWKSDGRAYRRVLPGFIELNVQVDGTQWRWTLYEKKRPLESGPAKSVSEAMTAVKEAASRRAAK
jgi:hypothetical protein